MKIILKYVFKFIIKLLKKLILLVDKLPEPNFEVTKLFENLEINSAPHTFKSEILLFNNDSGIHGEELFYTLIYTLNTEFH